MASEAEFAAMRRAIDAAAEARGSTNPNPAVGALVLNPAGEPAAVGVTQPVGGAHAEVAALEAAGERARGGTLVVTLEPCQHVGRTGPCTAAIVAAGVARVVYAVRDPHRSAGGGADVLREAGVDVEGGVLESVARPALQPWLTAVGRQRPHVTWKYAATMDGRTAAIDGTSRWITGEQSRVDVHRQRAFADAVVIGIGTVLADDTQLTVRDWPTSRQPLRVVVDSRARTPASARILDGAAETVVAVGENAEQGRVRSIEATGAQVLQLPERDGKVDLSALLAGLFDREVMQVLVEGGATLATSFVRERLVDQVVGYHAPALLGAGLPVLTDLGVATMADAQRLRLTDVSMLGDDVRMIACVDQGSV